MPLVIGVTGSIATGKSSVCEALVELGAIHCNADTLVHRLYDPGTPGFDRVVAEFGQDVVGADGYVDRRVLGSKVFGDREAMGRLTRAMGDISGLIRSTIEEWRATLPADASAVMEAVNLIEPGYSAWCDQTWLVAAEPDSARPRLMSRNGFSEEEANQRLSSQRNWRDRAPAADFVLHNDSTVEDLRAAVEAEFRRIHALHRAGTLPPSAYHAWREQNPLPQAVTRTSG
jgi:dephospho-CoA kinase